MQKEGTAQYFKEGEIPRTKDLYLGTRKVKLPFYDTPLTSVAVKGYGKNPLMLLTNLEIAEEDPLNILEIYLTRWKCEESFRFLKQSYNLENIRVQSYIALRNTVSSGFRSILFYQCHFCSGIKTKNTSQKGL